MSCFDAAGNRADTAFVVMYARGGTQEGTLVTARFASQTVPGSTQLVLNGYTSSLGGAPSGVRDGIGRYTVWLQRDTAGSPNHEGVQVSSAFGSCAVTKATSVDGLSLKLTVSCVGFTGHGPVDTPFDVSYTRGVNILGMLNLASDAHATVPMLTANTQVVVPMVQRDRIYGSTAGIVSAGRLGQGTYLVRLGQQAEGTGDGATVVTAYGSDARCRETGSWVAHDGPASSYDRVVAVSCVDPGGNAVDTAFYLQHTTRQ